jgi:hypothetical protein
VEIRVKHPHQLLPKLLEPRGLVVVELPFPLERSIFLFISASQLLSFSAFQLFSFSAFTHRSFSAASRG